METVSDLRQELVSLIEGHKGQLNLVEKIVAGDFSVEHLRRLGVQLYAEARSALQVKIPERIRLCPLSAGEARRLWCRILAEESGDFKPGHDHASLIAPVCEALGATSEDMEHEYQKYLVRMETVRREEPSLEITLREITRMYIDEAVLAQEANRIGDALREKYGIPEKTLFYFRLHAEVDIEHSNAALDELVRYATRPALKTLVLETAQESLACFPIWIDRT